MAAGKYNFTIESGATFRKTITWKDSAGDLVDLTGYSAKLQFRDTITATAVLLELSTTNNKITLNSLGKITLYASPTDTTSLSNKKKCVYDLLLTEPNAVDADRLLEGKATISLGVTH